jgi:hypothetical protein
MARAPIPADPWHYSRPELASKYLRFFDVGFTCARALFAKRRMGKSELLEQDLIPAARELGYITVYLNLWDTGRCRKNSSVGSTGRLATVIAGAVRSVA